MQRYRVLGNGLFFRVKTRFDLPHCGLTYWPPMQAMLGTVSLNFNIWKYIIAVVASLFVLAEIEKFVIRWGMSTFSPIVKARL